MPNRPHGSQRTGSWWALEVRKPVCTQGPTRGHHHHSPRGSRHRSLLPARTLARRRSAAATLNKRSSGTDTDTKDTENPPPTPKNPAQDTQDTSRTDTGTEDTQDTQDDENTPGRSGRPGRSPRTPRTPRTTRTQGSTRPGGPEKPGRSGRPGRPKTRTEDIRGQAGHERRGEHSKHRGQKTGGFPTTRTPSPPPWALSRRGGQTRRAPPRRGAVAPVSQDDQAAP
jgi:hypothetical protein